MTLLFTVENTRETDMGVVIVGYAPRPDTPLPKRGALVEVQNPDGSTFSAEVADVHVEFSSRGCFTERPVNRAILIRQNGRVQVLAGARIRDLG